ncbi:MAG: DUF1775 domain-containing protein [Acidimicrobiia bacterium]
MKRTVTVLLGTAMLAGWAVPAWAHVTAEDPSVPKDSDAKITFSVPVEEDGHANAMHAMSGGGPEKKFDPEPGPVYNKEVEIEVPRGFEVLACDQTPDWTCEAEPTKGSEAAGQAPGGTITFTRVTKSGSDMDHLSFTVHTPTQVGRYSFPTTQWTSDGEVTEWRGDGVTSKNPSPIVQVVDEEGETGPDAGHDHK